MTGPSLLIKSAVEAQSLLQLDEGRLINKMISLGDPNGWLPGNWRQVQDVLRLEFHDVERSNYEAYKAPSPKHIKEIIKFAKRVGSEEYDGIMLVHCQAGKARSSAAAFICLCVWKPGKEQENLDEIYRINPIAQPNRLMIEYADELMGLGGAMVTALKRKPDNGSFYHLSRTRRW